LTVYHRLFGHFDIKYTRFACEEVSPGQKKRGQKYFAAARFDWPYLVFGRFIGSPSF
jgi:hypothetical protein